MCAHQLDVTDMIMIWCGSEAIRYRDTVVYGAAGGNRSAKWIEL